VIKKTMEKIRARVQHESAVSDEKKSELLGLLSSLESQVAQLSETNSEQAASIAGFVERSAHEATRRKRHPELLEISLEGLAASAKGFEASHPVLVEDINAVCNMLANIGI
jgi:hypothetical protein